MQQAVRVRAGGRCEYCRLPEAFSPVPFWVDHIRPRKHRGQTVETNLALACPMCNQRKGSNLSGVDPATDAIVPLFNPRTDVWDAHFAWFGATIIAKTAVGRATVDVMALNESYQVKIRTALMREGHMP